MLAINQLDGFGGGPTGPAYASYVLNGTDEVLVRTLSTSGASTTLFTYSFWMKVIAFKDGTSVPLLQVINTPTNTQFMFFSVTLTGDRIELSQDAGSVDWSELCNSLTPDIATGTWEHIVMQYDSTQGTADNRLRFYRNGSLLTGTDGPAAAPGASEANILFSNGFQHQLGAQLDISAFSNVKLAFVEVLEGVSQDASVFAFTNGSTWTRKPYTGSYGTYGFRLDGTNLFNDVSGNAQNFTGTNMDATNLDTGDLPPYT